MRQEFVASKSRTTAKTKCPWFAIVVRVEGGFMCFEALADYHLWKAGVQVAPSASETPLPDEPDVAPSDRDRFKRELAKYQRRIDREAEARVRAELAKVDAKVRASWEEIVMPAYEEGQRRYRLYRDAHTGVFTKAEFMLLRKVLHPDTGSNVSAEKRNEAFGVFNEKKLLLFKEPKPEPESDLPKTLAELLARKKTKAV